MTAQAIDDVLAGSFPASDPPAWTAGIARPRPTTAARPDDRARAPDESQNVRADVLDLSRGADAERTPAKAVVSLIGAIGLALLVPVAILAIITPVALALRAAIDLAAWILAFMG